MKIFIGSAFVLFYMFNISGYAQDEFRAYKLDSEVIFDGIPDEKAWQGLSPLPTYMLQPNPGEAPTEKTEIIIAYTDDYLWIGGRFFDQNAELIKANTKKRDDFSDNSDFFGIMIDGLNTKETGFIFCTSPLATRLDYMICNDGRDNNSFNSSWNTFWDVKTAITDKGWFMEMRIPFSSLRFRNNGGIAKMGITAYRWIPHKNEMITFPQIDPKYGKWAKQRPSLAKNVYFEGIKPSRPVYLTPYILGGFNNTWDINDSGDSYIKNSKPSIEVGGDLKYCITSNLTLDVTLNTDFAQVENDDQQVNMTRFSLYYPEKRQFFQERSDLINFDLGNDAKVFYSRKIGIYEDEKVRILGGARLTGKIRGWDIGLIDLQTASLNDSVPSENFGVVRVRHQVFNPFSHAGGIITSRVDVNGNYNVTYAFDSYIKVFGDDYLDFKISQVQDSEITGANMRDKTFVRLNWDKRNEEGFSYRASLNWAGKDFVPDMGFMLRSDYWVYGSRLRYGWIPGTESVLYSHTLYWKMVNYTSTAGKPETFTTGPGWSFSTKNNSSGTVELEYHREILTEDFYLNDDVFIPVGNYTFYGIKGEFGTPSSGTLNMTGTYELGSFFDGNRVSFKLKPNWALSSSFNLEGLYQLDKAAFEDRDMKFINHIGQIKLIYMLNTKITTSIFVQYNSEINDVLTNFRLRYNPSEGNDFFLVYNEGRNTKFDREVPHLPVYDGKNIMVKYTYTFTL